MLTGNDVYPLTYVFSPKQVEAYGLDDDVVHLIEHGWIDNQPIDSFDDYWLFPVPVPVVTLLGVVHTLLD